MATSALTVYSDEQARCPGKSLNDIGRWFYRLGNSFCKLGDIEKALRSWNDAFLVRGCEFSSDKDYEWKKFHDIQFAIYLLGKKRLCVSLSEGDMIHDLIRMKWEELKNAIAHSEFSFEPDNTGAWYRTVEIDFPWDLDVAGFDGFLVENLENVAQRPAVCGISPLSLLDRVKMTR
ncbi:MAG: hypothetical protein ACOX6K_03605 [Sphaerochaetaceae bacterium]|jgi:hypothetical protein